MAQLREEAARIADVGMRGEVSGIESPNGRAHGPNWKIPQKNPEASGADLSYSARPFSPNSPCLRKNHPGFVSSRGMVEMLTQFMKKRGNFYLVLAFHPEFPYSTFTQ
jgi:hypothetical protein